MSDTVRVFILAAAVIAVVWVWVLLWVRYRRDTRRSAEWGSTRPTDDSTKTHTLDVPDGVFVRDTDDGKRFALIAKGVCPHCRSETKFFAGPRGGMSQNISCEACGWWFNVTAFPNGEGIAQDIGFKDKEPRPA